MSEAKRLNLPIKLSVFTANSAAEKFYVRSGFRKLERDDWFQSMIWNGEKVVEVIFLRFSPVYSG